MIEVIPSIAIYEGKVVRLKQGDFTSKITYSISPIDQAKQFEDHGVHQVHLIDLEGAKQGRAINVDMLQLVSGHTELKISYGGGINNDEDILKVFEFGAEMATIGSMAVRERELFSSWLISYGRKKLMLSADTFHGKIKTKGWQKETEEDLFDLLDHYYECSIEYVKCADIAKDGLMDGPNFKLYEDILKRYPDMKLIASGGLSCVDDFKRLEDIGVYAAIFGKAYYENKISLSDLDRYFATA